MEDKKERKARTYGTQIVNQINGKVYFMGLSPSQFVIVFMISIIFGIIFRLYSIPLIISIFWIFSKISRENRKGHPNFLSSLMLKYLNSYKTHFEDKDFVFSKLKKKKD